MMGYNSGFPHTRSSLMSVAMSMSVPPVFGSRIMLNNIELEGDGQEVFVTMVHAVQPAIEQATKDSGEPWCSMGKGLREIADCIATTSLPFRYHVNLLWNSLTHTVTESIVTPCRVYLEFGWNSMRQTVTQSFHLLQAAQDRMAIRSIIYFESFGIGSINQWILSLNQSISSLFGERAMDLLTDAADYAAWTFFRHYGGWPGVVDYAFRTISARASGNHGQILRALYSAYYCWSSLS